MPDERPSGSAPFTFANRLLQYFQRITSTPPFELATAKRDGFKVIIDKTAKPNAAIHSKNGHELGKDNTTKFGVMGLKMREKFAPLLETPIIYHKDGKEHRVSTIYAEAVWDKDDGHDDNLQALMHASKDDVDVTHLCAFDLEFEDKGLYLPLADKLELVRKQVGPEYAVRTLIDARKPITQWDMDNFKYTLETEEGVVLVTEEGKKRIKHKTILPVPLLLVAVGFTNIGTKKIPTHFVWALKVAGEYKTVLIDNKLHLFDESRALEGKLYLKAHEIEYNKTTRQFTCPDVNPVSKNYNDLLGMIRNLREPTSLSKHTARVNKEVYTIGKQRKENFYSAIFRFLKTPKLGVMGANRLWTLKHAAGEVEVHLQAPQFLASDTAGHKIHRDLATGAATPITYDQLIRLASIPRHCRLHAEEVYGRKVDLVHGKYEEGDSSDESDEEVDTPQPSSDEDEDAFRKRKFWTTIERNGKRTRLSDTLSDV